jgi:hypothetical protein
MNPLRFLTAILVAFIGVYFLLGEGRPLLNTLIGENAAGPMGGALAMVCVFLSAWVLTQGDK